MHHEFSAPRREIASALRRWAVPGAAALLLAVRVRRLFDPYLVVDDAYISFRYALNFAHGLGLVYNQGERVEGYSNFLWTVLLAAGARGGLDIVLFSIFAALLASLASLLLIWAWSASLAADRVHSPERAGARADAGPTAIVLTILPPLLFAATGSQARYVMSGMETLLFGALVLAAAWLLVMRDAPVASGCLFALAAMTRPEGAMYWLIAAGLALLPLEAAATGPPAGGATALGALARLRLRQAMLLIGSFALPFGAYFAWRWSYYGYPLPNTFYAKADGFSWVRIANGRAALREVADSWSIYPIAVAAAAALPSCLGRRRGASTRHLQAMRLSAAYVVLTVVYFVYVGGDFLPFFGPRFLMPALPFALLLASEGLYNLGEATGRLLARIAPPDRRGGRCSRRRIAVLAQPAVLSAGVLLLAANALWCAWPSRRFDAVGLARTMASWEDLGRWVEVNTSPTAVIADGAAGIVPFYSGRVNIDMYGLTDLHIGHMSPLAIGFKITAHEKYDPRYVLSRHPDLLISFVGRDRTPRTAGLARVKDWVWACYRPVALLKDGPSADRGWVLPSRVFTGALFDQGYKEVVLERRRGRGASACTSYERSMGVSPAETGGTLDPAAR